MATDTEWLKLGWYSRRLPPANREMNNNKDQTVKFVTEIIRCCRAMVESLRASGE